MREESLIEALQDISDIKCSVESIAYADNNIDWEQRRYEIAKMCVAAFVNRCGNVSDFGVRNSVGYADALIAELKKANETKQE